MTQPSSGKAFPPLTLAMLAIAQFVAAGYARMTGHGQNIEELAGRGGIRPPEVPAGYAFSIWMVIFALSVAYGIYYATKGKEHALCRQVSLPAAILFLCSSAWMLAAQTIGDGWHLVTLIVIMWALSTRALLTVCYAPVDDKPRRYILQPLFGLYTGWLTAAMFLNITGTFAKEVGTLGLSTNLYAMLTLIPAGILALALIKRTKAQPYLFGAFIWALVGIMAANVAVSPMNMPIIAVCGALIAVLIVMFSYVRQAKAA